MTSKTTIVRVGSTNPAKIKAVEDTFTRMFDDEDILCIGTDAPSGVADQPMNAADTRLGAINRVNACMQHDDADFYAAMEGGVDVSEDGPVTFAYVVIANKERRSVGRSASLPLPGALFEALLRGDELGPTIDKVFGTTNVKQKGGAIGLFTNGRETRSGAYTQALTLAMAPFLHPELY